MQVMSRWLCLQRFTGGFLPFPVNSGGTTACLVCLSVCLSVTHFTRTSLVIVMVVECLPFDFLSCCFHIRHPVSRFRFRITENKKKDFVT